MNNIVDLDVFKELQLYKKMYSTLFNGIVDAEKLGSRDEVIEFLKQKQIVTEEMFMSFGE